jgi:nitrogen fixation protein NifX
MRIAFTSTDGKAIDEHFGQATHFHVWEVAPDAAQYVGIVGAFGGQGKLHEHGPDHVVGLGAGAAVTSDEDDRIKARADAIDGCALVYTVQIGGPAAAKLIARHIHPMKTGTEVPIEAALAKLQEVMRGKPPPWLRKAMGLPPQPASLEEDEEV